MAERTMQVSEFKAKCIAALKQVQSSGASIVVTLRGRPLARLEPIARGRRLGALAGFGEARGELIDADFGDEWEMNGRRK